MRWEDLREGVLRLFDVLRRRRRESDLEEELEFHLAMKAQKYREGQGLSSPQAAERAKRDFGGLEQWKEVCRDVAQWRPLEEFGRDLALAARLLRKTPVFTSVALITLTLAIGANTAIFSLMNAILLKPLPLPAVDRLVILRMQPDELGYAFCYPILKEMEKQLASEMTVFAFSGEHLQMRGPEGVERVSGELVSGQFFEALGVAPEAGRWIEPNDDRHGAPGEAVAVISHRLWRDRMGNDAKVLGRSIVLNRVAFTVIGVMPERFRGAGKDEQPDVFIPLEFEPRIDPGNNIDTGFAAWWIKIGGRLKDGVSLDRVNTLFRARSQNIFQAAGSKEWRRFDGSGAKDLHFVAEPGATGYSYLRFRFRKPVTILMALVFLVLLVACLNLATLLTARSASRAREIATRFALGASRARLVRQMITESAVLAASGAALGLLVSPLMTYALVAVLTPSDLRATGLEVAPDLSVFAFIAAIAMLTTVMTGVAPALRSTDRNLQGGAREGNAERRRLWPRAMLAIEVALALVLVTGASLLGYSLVKLHETPVGFEPRGLVYLPLDMDRDPRDMQTLMRAYRRFIDDVRSIPGVTSASLTYVVPLTGSYLISSAVGNQPVWENWIGPGYFRTMHIPLVAGREFEWTDTGTSEEVAILNESAARLYFHRMNAVGQHVSPDQGKTKFRVVGVVADAKYSALRDATPPTMYTPAGQNKINSYTLAVRTSGTTVPLIAAVGNLAKRFTPQAPPPIPVTMEQTIAESLATERMMASLALFFGALALLITGIGLYGTLAYATERRTGEIGIRLALGARQADIVSMVCSENGIIALAGCVVGVAASLATSKFIASFLYDVSAKDPAVFGAAALALLCVAGAASLVPAAKAARIDPVVAIRYE